MENSVAKKRINIGSLVVKLVLTWVIIAFVVYPNINLLMSVFMRDGQFSTDAFGKILSSQRAIKSLLNSFILAITLIFTVNIVGTLVVLFTEYWDIKGAKILKLGYIKIANFFITFSNLSFKINQLSFVLLSLWLTGTKRFYN